MRILIIMLVVCTSIHLDSFCQPNPTTTQNTRRNRRIRFQELITSNEGLKKDTARLKKEIITFSSLLGKEKIKSDSLIGVIKKNDSLNGTIITTVNGLIKTVNSLVNFIVVNNPKIKLDSTGTIVNNINAVNKSINVPNKDTLKPPTTTNTPIPINTNSQTTDTFCKTVLKLERDFRTIQDVKSKIVYRVNRDEIVKISFGRNIETGDFRLNINDTIKDLIDCLLATTEINQFRFRYKLKIVLYGNDNLSGDDNSEKDATRLLAKYLLINFSNYNLQDSFEDVERRSSNRDYKLGLKLVTVNK